MLWQQEVNKNIYLLCTIFLSHGSADFPGLACVPFLSRFSSFPVWTGSVKELFATEGLVTLSLYKI